MSAIRTSLIRHIRKNGNCGIAFMAASATAESFFDHSRIEVLRLVGITPAVNGWLFVSRQKQAWTGLELKRKNAEKYRV